MKATFEHGAALDFLTQDELVDGLHRSFQNWITEATRGICQRRFSAQGTIVAGNLTIGGPNSSHQLGPTPGFVWSVRRLAVSGIRLGTDFLSIYLNDANPSSAVMPQAFGAAADPGARFFDGNQLLLNPSDTLLFTGTGLVATGIVTITGMAMELPVSQIYRLV